MAPPPFLLGSALVHASPASAKALLRAQLRAMRKDSAAQIPDAAERAALNLPLERFAHIQTVSAYRAMGSEIDPRPLLMRFAQAGARLALPAALDRDAPLIFRAYAPGDGLAPDAFGVMAPLADAPQVEPDLVIAPLLAFDRFGTRLGQGAGHYDRTLAALRAVRPIFVLGLAYAGQEVARVPSEPHDQPLDAILTEKGYSEAQRNL